jgi:hypothetical protein
MTLIDGIKDKYKIVFDPQDPKKWCVELLESCDPFHGIILSYGQFTIKKDGDADQNPKFNFETEIVYVPERLRDVTLPDEAEDKMQTLLAQILIDIIENNMSKAKSENGKLYLELVKDDK